MIKSKYLFFIISINLLRWSLKQRICELEVAFADS